MQTVRFLKERQQPVHIIRFFHKMFRIPLTVGHREEVPSVHVDRPRQATDRIDDGVDDVRPKRHRLALAKRFGSGGLDPTIGIARWPSPKNIIFATRVDADHSPHPMIMG
jgi:hypothetical protein